MILPNISIKELNESSFQLLKDKTLCISYKDDKISKVTTENSLHRRPLTKRLEECARVTNKTYHDDTELFRDVMIKLPRNNN